MKYLLIGSLALLTGCGGAAYRVTSTDVAAGTFRIQEARGARWACVSMTRHQFQCLADTSRSKAYPSTTITGSVKDISKGPIQVQYPLPPDPIVIYKTKTIYKTKIVEKKAEPIKREPVN